MATDAYAPQKRYVQKQKAEGFTSLTVWVPEDNRADIIEHARKLRVAHVSTKERATH